ncbi:hypothetical protein HJFPF1_09062 [Paramyrothecium foliicola]|nr:hypothetical protein HJFPF1_09062 [Paramyrothecium foliicola]
MIALKPTPDGSPRTRKQAVAQPPTSRVVPKPVPQSQTQDPRTYHIEQLKRRFSPKETTNPDGSTSLAFKLVPSDPDFPYELTHLECEVRVPAAYPEERPALRVRNKDIPRGFGINIERGWEKLAEERKNVTLLALTNALDKNLESFLSEQKVETVKLVAFRDTRHLDAAAAKANVVNEQPAKTAVAPPAPPVKHYVYEESYTKEQMNEARARRAQEVRQLEARMGRMLMYRRSADGIVYTLPIDPKRRGELPSGLRPVQSLHLIVPLLYPLQDLRVQLNQVESDIAEPVEELFAERAAQQKQMTLMSHMNFLAQNLHNLAKQAEASAAKAKAEAEAEAAAAASAAPNEPATGSQQPVATSSADRSHIQVIPRPPEWSVDPDADEESEDYTDSGDEDDGGAVLEDGQEPAPLPAETPERGTMLSFPSVELHGIEVLKVSILSLSVKCDRCKTVNDLTGLKPEAEKAISCKKCAAGMAAKFRQTLVHEHSARAGFLDLSGCKVADMLPSTFVPTCEKCSTDSQGLVSVRGETTTNVCRECHGKFTFKIPDVRFLFITPGSLPPPNLGPRQKQVKLGLHAGEPLPGRGTCAHYRKSYRWFRFSCCSRVHPCDKCHDSTEDHIIEWANRMICGWCSREQNYAVEACNFCGRSVIGRKGKGFWEGGKGTRDQRLMSRKDPRKYKRLGSAKKD